jgi:hypothetical protein
MELERIAQDGAVTPPKVIEAARPDDAVLHPCFTWEDSDAAEQWRLWEARHLLGSITVRYIENENEDRMARAFVNVYMPVKEGEEEPARMYVQTAQALGDEALRRQVLEGALREIRGWRKRYAIYKEFAGILTAIDQAEEAVAQMALVEITPEPVLAM